MNITGVAYKYSFNNISNKVAANNNSFAQNVQTASGTQQAAQLSDERPASRPKATSSGIAFSKRIEHNGQSINVRFLPAMGPFVFISDRLPAQEGTRLAPGQTTRFGESRFVPIAEFAPDLLQSTVNALEHTASMANNLFHATGRNLPFKDRVRETVNAFETLRSGFEGDDQLEYSESAFRSLLLDFGRQAGGLIPFHHWHFPDKNELLNSIAKEEERINYFGETFLDNFAEHGAQRAFEIAWEEASFETMWN